MKSTPFDCFIPKIISGEMLVEDIPLAGQMLSQVHQFFVNLMQALVDQCPKK